MLYRLFIDLGKKLLRKNIFITNMK